MRTQWYKLGTNEKIPEGATEIVWRSIRQYCHVSCMDELDIDFYNSQGFKDVGGLFVSCYSYGFPKGVFGDGKISL